MDQEDLVEAVKSFASKGYVARSLEELGYAIPKTQLSRNEPKGNQELTEDPSKTKSVRTKSDDGLEPKTKTRKSRYHENAAGSKTKTLKRNNSYECYEEAQALRCASLRNLMVKERGPSSRSLDKHSSHRSLRQCLKKSSSSNEVSDEGRTNNSPEFLSTDFPGVSADRGRNGKDTRYTSSRDVTSEESEKPDPLKNKSPSGRRLKKEGSQGDLPTSRNVSSRGGSKRDLKGHNRVSSGRKLAEHRQGSSKGMSKEQRDSKKERKVRRTKSDDGTDTGKLKLAGVTEEELQILLKVAGITLEQLHELASKDRTDVEDEYDKAPIEHPRSYRRIKANDNSTAGHSDILQLEREPSVRDLEMYRTSSSRNLMLKGEENGSPVSVAAHISRRNDSTRELLVTQRSTSAKNLRGASTDLIAERVRAALTRQGSQKQMTAPDTHDLGYEDIGYEDVVKEVSNKREENDLTQILSRRMISRESMGFGPRRKPRVRTRRRSSMPNCINVFEISGLGRVPVPPVSPKVIDRWPSTKGLGYEETDYVTNPPSLGGQSEDSEDDCAKPTSVLKGYYKSRLSRDAFAYGREPLHQIRQRNSMNCLYTGTAINA